MGRINKLDQNIVNLIAAGEVVERPASVVKELIENSIDAGSDKIVVKVRDGGAKEITIIDNGHGISDEDIELAFTQHATSKVSKATDLDSIFTLGFRGEALSSISSVSEIEIETTSNNTKTIAKLKNGQISSKESTKGYEQGTSISIIDIFNNVPARKKFLKTENTEFKKIQEAFNNTALIYPNIHLELYKDGKLLKKLPKTNNQKDRIYELFGQDISENLYSLSRDAKDIKITGFIGNPMTARKDNKLQYIFLNNRPITDKTIQAAVSQAYHGFIHKDQRPIYFLFIEIDPKEVDVNVHPRKLEVKFTNNNQVFSAVFNSIKNTLENQTKEDISSRIKPSNSFFTDKATLGIQRSEVNRNTVNQPTVDYHTSINKRPPQNKKLRVNEAITFSKEILKNPTGNINSEIRTISKDLHDKFSTSNTPLLQVFNTYIIYEQSNTVVFVDQHAAAEKIMFEKLMNQYEKDFLRTKKLLLPDIIEMGKSDKESTIENKEHLSKMGIIIEDFGGDSIQVIELPEVFPTNINIKQLIIKINDDIETGGRTTDKDVSELVIATMACHGSIRAGQPLSVIEMRQLLNDLDKCERPYNCPHGRPVSWEMSRSEMEKKFSRIL